MIGITRTRGALSVTDLLVGAEPDFSPDSMPLDDAKINTSFYSSISKDMSSRVVETFHDVQVGPGIFRDLSLLTFTDYYAVVDQAEKRVEFLLHFEFGRVRGVNCIIKLRQWRSSRLVSLTGKPEVYPKSASSYLITKHLMPKYPMLATPEEIAHRFWWSRFHDAFEAGCVVYELAGNEPVLYESADAIRQRPRSVEQFPSAERPAVISRAKIW